MHIKERLPDQAVIHFNCIPFQNGNFSKRKEFASRGSKFFPLKAVPYGMENHFNHIRLPPLNATITITHMLNCVMGPMLACNKILVLIALLSSEDSDEPVQMHSLT